MTVSALQAPNRAAQAALAAAGLLPPDLSAAWTEFFGMLPPKARILLLGGEPLPALADRMASERGASWQLHSAAGMRALPFAADSFDAVAGHQVLEGVEPTASLTELKRVLSPGADAQFLLQHVHAPLQHAARWAQLEADIVLKRVHMFRRVHKLVTLDASTVTAATDRAGNELRAGLQGLKQALADVSAQGGGRVLQWTLLAVQDLLRARNGMKSGTAGLEVDRAEELLRSVWRRASELVAQGRSTEQMQALTQYASAQGFTRIDCLPLQQTGGAPVAWQLLLHRP